MPKLFKKKEKVVVEIPELADDTILKVDNMTMRFGGLTAVNAVDFEVKRGEIFGLIGPNGAGKTTIFNCITQFYKPTEGNVFYKQQDKPTVHLNTVKVHDVINHGIIRTFQNVELIWELTVLENLMVTHTRRIKGIILGTILRTPGMLKQEELIREKALNILSFLGLYHYKDIPPYGLPYGILKKIELARTLMIDPELIILDEPAAGLNDAETVELANTIELIRQMYDTTIFLIEHDMKLVMSISNRVCVLNFGKLIALGTPNEVQANTAVKEAYLGSE